jgi:hypothetical protein
MFHIVILICASSLAPQDCDRHTALDIISGPNVVSVLSCGMQAQALVANTAAIGRAEGEYMKIICERPTAEASIGTAE